MIYAIAAVLALILDQAVKYWTTVNIVVDTGEAKLLPGFLHLANVHNTGAAFSFLEGARWFFVAVCILFVAVVIYALAKDFLTGRVSRWSAVAIMAGAIGNCIDRIVCGYVVDMFEFDFLIFGKRFPVFNVADIYITLGVIVLCICILLEKPKAVEKSVGEAGRPVGTGTDKTGKRSLFRPRHKTVIPDFPKHETKESPAMDPADPFAEWERRIQVPAPKKAQEIREDVTYYTQPEKSARPENSEENTTHASHLDKLKNESGETPVPASDSFNLEDILAEFKDD